MAGDTRPTVRASPPCAELEASSPRCLGLTKPRALFCHRELRRAARRELVPLAIVQRPAAGLWSQPAPVLEKEGDALAQALVTDRAHPRRPHRACTGATLPSDD